MTNYNLKNVPPDKVNVLEATLIKLGLMQPKAQEQEVPQESAELIGLQAEKQQLEIALAAKTAENNNLAIQLASEKTAREKLEAEATQKDRLIAQLNGRTVKTQADQVATEGGTDLLDTSDFKSYCQRMGVPCPE